MLQARPCSLIAPLLSCRTIARSRLLCSSRVTPPNPPPRLSVLHQSPLHGKRHRDDLDTPITASTISGSDSTDIVGGVIGGIAAMCLLGPPLHVLTPKERSARFAPFWGWDVSTC
ncbi:hypothetical protein M405DRAFT_395984 [Rhizopogon salebrosus TDB-379]|nr:hypothetical protein M405DRAFT_395984 [Rhizopogon salebrosus TDB-379]